MKYCRKLLFIPLIAFTTALWAHSGATGIVKERMDSFEDSKASMKLLKKAVRSNDFAIINQEAGSIHRWAIQLIDHFPEGSNPPPSEALDLIWEEFEQFKNSANRQIKASAALQQAGLNGDSEKAAKAFAELAKSCKGCHDSYRD